MVLLIAALVVLIAALVVLIAVGGGSVLMAVRGLTVAVVSICGGAGVGECDCGESEYEGDFQRGFHRFFQELKVSRL